MPSIYVSFTVPGWLLWLLLAYLLFGLLAYLPTLALLNRRLHHRPLSSGSLGRAMGFALLWPAVLGSAYRTYHRKARRINA